MWGGRQERRATINCLRRCSRDLMRTVNNSFEVIAVVALTLYTGARRSETRERGEFSFRLASPRRNPLPI